MQQHRGLIQGGDDLHPASDLVGKGEIGLAGSCQSAGQTAQTDPTDAEGALAPLEPGPSVVLVQKPFPGLLSQRVQPRFGYQIGDLGVLADNVIRCGESAAVQLLPELQESDLPDGLSVNQ